VGCRLHGHPATLNQPEPIDPVPAPNIETIASLAKRRGFIFPSSEIYGGMAGFWDYGPLGVELKNNVKAAWWRHMVHLRDDVVGIDAAIVMNPRVWEASGHVAGFSDPMVDCRNCKLRFREDDLKGPPSEIACPNCGQRGTLTEARQFNLMFATHVGPVADSASVAYLRPETAQAMFVQFDNVATTTRRKLPFGIAQIGRSFRNEITPGNFIFRLREFEQMEMEFFVHPRDEDTWFSHWVQARHQWWTDVLGISPQRLRLRPHEADELSHYSKQTTDIEYEFPIGWLELEGVADRTDFDLKAHASASGKKLSIFDEESGEHLVPFVIEPAMGVDRAVLTVLVDAYEEEQLEKEKRAVLRIRPELAPQKAAVLPLLRNRGELVERAQRLTADLKQLVTAAYDDTASIGKLYRRQDEIGTPYCVTVDVETLDDGAATIRERDSMTQERVSLELIPGRVADLVAGRAAWEGVPREATPA
jgi:glycyl-tRNA synthetase